MSENNQAKWIAQPFSVTLNPQQLYAYILDHSLHETPIQKSHRDEISKHPRAVMNSSPDESQFLAFLLELTKAKNVIGPF